MDAGKSFHVVLTVEDTILVAYIDDKIAFSARMYDLKGAALGIYAQNGGMCLKDARLSTEQSD